MSSAPDHRAEEPFAHLALHYRGSREYLAGTIPFIDEALTAGEPVAAAVPARNLRLLQDALGASAARVHMVDMAEAGANPGRIIPGVLRAFADRHPDRRVRIIGEPIWPGRSEVEYPACVQHEALINPAFAGRDVAILCPYDVDGLDGQAITDSQATHPVLIDGRGRRASAEWDPERVIADYNRPLPPPPRTAIERAVDRGTIDNARWFVTAFGRKVGLRANRLIDLEIAVTELATNSIRHGGGTGMLRVWAEGDRLVCEVADAGHLTDPLAGHRPVEDDHGGHGLLLVNHVVDLLRTHTGAGGTTMRIHMKLDPDQGHRSA
jgi:anti-sigma regulatory factor (Ser/Thr protein kinase)